jgi:hypothetical protein
MSLASRCNLEGRDLSHLPTMEVVVQGAAATTIVVAVVERVGVEIVAPTTTQPASTLAPTMATATSLVETRNNRSVNSASRPNTR